MGGPWEDYGAQSSGDGPWADYAPPPEAKPTPPKRSTAHDVGKGLLSGLTEGATGIADAVMHATPMGVVRNALNVATGKPFAALGSDPLGLVRHAAPQASQIARYQPETGAGRLAKTVGTMAPNAAVPGNVLSRVANVALPAAGSEIAGGMANAMGASPQVQAGARAVGGLVGAGAGSVRLNALGRQAGPDAETANLLARRGKVDAGAMAQKAQAMRDAGTQPTLIDVAGDRGRRLVRAVGVKNEVAGETLQENARTVSASTKPAVMARTRGLGPVPGSTGDEVASKLRTARSNQANKDYAGPYTTQVKLEPDTLSALSDEHGRAALRQARSAASARMDTAQVEEIDGLLKMNPAPDSVSAGTLDRVRIAMRNRASAMARNNRSDVASGLGDRVKMIDQTLAQVPEIQPARANYKATSQAIGVLGKERKDVFSTDPTDYGKWLDGLSPEARHANQVAIRQEILDTLGGQRASTFGSIDELASSEYAKANLRQALGKDADPYIAHLGARLEQARNANMVSPGGGSRTAVLENDLSKAKTAIGVGRSAIRGDVVGAAAKLGEWFLSRGISDAHAMKLAEDAVDPSKLDGVIRALQGRYGKASAQKFLSYRNAALSGALAVGSQATAAAPPQR
jgi:hypothetical protein